MTTAQGGQVGRIPSGRLRQLGPVNWVLAKLAARTTRVPVMHLFTTLGQRQTLFWVFSLYCGRLLRGKLPRADTELVILRVAHLRSSEYELQHHRPMARKVGLDANVQAAIFAWPDVPPEAEGRLSTRQQVLLQAADQLVNLRTITADIWQQLAEHLNRRLLIEFCLLATNYDGLAATISALEIPLDHAPD